MENMAVNIRKRLINAVGDTVYYINTPIADLCALLFKISSFMFILYLFSFHHVMVAVLVPAYMMMFYLYSLFWGVVKRYAFRLLPFVAVIVFANIPIIFSAVLIRKLLFVLIF